MWSEGKRTLLVSSSFLPGRGGIETYLAELSEELNDRIAVLAPATRGGQPLPARLEYPIIGYDGSLLVPSPRVTRAIVAAAREIGTNQILFGTPWPLILLGPRLVRAGLRYASILHGAEILVPGAIPILRRRLARALSGADVLFAVSNFTLQRAEELITNLGLAIPPSAILHAGVDIDRFNPRVDGAPFRQRWNLGGRKVLLTLGRLVPRKGTARLIAAMPELSRRWPDTTLVVAGTGPQERRLRKQARSIDAPVLFTGRVSDDDAPRAYAAADVFVLPVADRWWGLDAEGLGVVLLEASASGVPCVTGRSGGTPEAVVDGETGHVVDARNNDQLVSAISKLLEDSVEAKKMGAAGRAHVQRHFAKGQLPDSFLRWLG
jgi:phosphatidyl-myo-inositol dimannoside synthase